MTMVQAKFKNIWGKGGHHILAPDANYLVQHPRISEGRHASSNYVEPAPSSQTSRLFVQVHTLSQAAHSCRYQATVCLHVAAQGVGRLSSLCFVTWFNKSPTEEIVHFSLFNFVWAEGRQRKCLFCSCLLVEVRKVMYSNA